MSRLLEEYNTKIKEDLRSKLGLKNIFEVPKLNKIILNMGVGEGKEDSKLIDKAAEDLRLATRQLGMIVGKVDVEEILGSIFNDFCIGK